MMINKMIVTIKDYSESCISIRVFDREKRNSQNFLISKDKLKEGILRVNFMYDTDIDSTIHMRTNEKGVVECKINFVHVDYRGSISGYQRLFSIPLSAIVEAMSGVTSKILVDFEKPEHTPKFSFSDNAYKFIGKMNKAQRHALVKSLVKNFYISETVKVSKDFGQDLFFEEKHPCFFTPVCGGICLHKGEVKGKDGLFHDMLVYGKHT